jgi:uncharacterized protein YbjT (DUF2867 family)
MEKGKIAIIIGATGLVGNHLLKTLLEDTYYSKVVILTRRSTNIRNEKLEEHIVDFNQPESYMKIVKGDVLFSCMGTTIKKAGSKEAQWKIDYTYQYEIAEAAKENGVESMFLVSSSGANAKSRIFYTRMKGELEEVIRDLNFPNYAIFQPSLLLGERPEVRVGEKFGEKLAKYLIKIPAFKKYKPIKGEEVAVAMNNYFKLGNHQQESVFVLDEIFGLL